MFLASLRYEMKKRIGKINLSNSEGTFFRRWNRKSRTLRIGDTVSPKTDRHDLCQRSFHTKRYVLIRNEPRLKKHHALSENEANFERLPKIRRRLPKIRSRGLHFCCRLSPPPPHFGTRGRTVGVAPLLSATISASLRIFNAKSTIVSKSWLSLF